MRYCAFVLRASDRILSCASHAATRALSRPTAPSLITSIGPPGSAGRQLLRLWSPERVRGGARGRTEGADRVRASATQQESRTAVAPHSKVWIDLDRLKVNLDRQTDAQLSELGGPGVNPYSFPLPLKSKLLRGGGEEFFKR